MACPEEIAVLVTGGEGGGEVVGLSAADIWYLEWRVALAAYLGQRSGLPSPSPDRHLGCSGETETTWWVASLSIITNISSTSQPHHQWGKRISSSQHWVTFLGNIQRLNWDKDLSPNSSNCRVTAREACNLEKVIIFFTGDGGCFQRSIIPYFLKCLMF